MRSDGFTLIELLIVLTIMALLTSLAVPLFDRVLPGLELRSSARELAADMRMARDRALRTKRSTFIEIDLDRRGYKQGEDGPLIAFPAGSEVILTVAERERIDGSRGRIRFFPDGTATGGKIVIGHGKSRIALEVDWFDGRSRQIDAPG